MPLTIKQISEAWKINSIIKAFGILKSFTEQTPNWSLTQLSKEVKMPKSSLSNTLKTLEYCDILERDETSQLYHLGIELLEMSYKARKGLPIIEYAMQYLDEIQQETDEIVYFTIPRYGKVLYLDASYPGKKKVTYSITGKTLEMHCTGVGKVMLSKLSNEDIKKIVDYHGMPKYTPQTITNYDDLIKEMDIIRERGYAIDNGEESPGVKCVAVPIMDGYKVIGAISISGSIISIKDHQIVEYAEKLMEVSNLLRQKSYMFPQCPILPVVEKFDY